MESVGVLPTSFDVRHEPTQLLSSMSTPQPHNSQKATSSLHSEFLCSPSELANVAGPSRHMISSPRRACTPITARVPPPPPIDTSVATPTKRSPIPLERVPTEPASAPPPRQQPSADELAVLGIKVRDFAFEPSSLPPVPTVQRPFFREFNRQFDETPEEAERRRLNEVRRLEFNTPRRKNETPEEREARVLALGGPGIGGFPNTNNSTSMRFAPRLDENSVMKLPGLPNFGAASSHSTSDVVPSTSLTAGLNTSLPLRRHPSEVYTHQASSISPISTSAGIFRVPATQRQSPSASPLRVGETDAVQAHEPSITSYSPRLEWPAQSSQGTRSQFSTSVLQTESRSQGISTSSQSQLPGFSISQVDSEMDDEECIKTPLVTPNGSLVFDDHHFDLDLVGSAADLERNRSNESLSRYLSSDIGAGTTQTDGAVRPSSLPDSQVAELLIPAGISSVEEDVSASQMGLESQDLLSQPAWQQQSQSPFQSLSQESEFQESQIEDVEMPESQPVSVERKAGTADCISTVTYPASFTRTSSTLLTPIRAYASACSNTASSSPCLHPIPRHSSDSSLSQDPFNAPNLGSSASHSLLRHSPSLGIGPSLSRQTSISSIHSKASPSATVTNRGKGRYNLRAPSKKARLFDSPSFTSIPPGRRTRSRTESAPLLKSVSGAAIAANARRSKSSASTRKRAMKDGRGETGNVDVDADVIMGEERNDGQETNAIAVK